MSRAKVPLRYMLLIGVRDRWRCHVCEQGYDSQDPWEIDHVLSLKRGGTNHLGNLSLCHRSCNRDKGAA